ncbi:MAG: DUF459 domain-containing protein [Treponema sp.]
MREQERSTRQGRYSPNQCIFFVVLVLIILLPFLGKRIGRPAQSIKNLYLKNIYSALVQPVIAFTEYFPLASIIPAVRAGFITAAGLGERGEWDSFFYNGEAYGEDADFLWAFDGSGVYPSNTDVLSDEGAGEAEGTVPAELKKHISQELLRNVAVSIPRSPRYPLRMFFFGDSQMHGIASGMKRALGSDTSITVEELSVHSSGFLRSDYYNWPQKLESCFAQQTSGTHFDAAVLFLGMNDYQDMIAAGSILYAGTPEWEEVYRRMVKKHIDIVLRSVPRLYWFGLPVVRKSAYNEKIQYLDSVHRSIAAEYDSKRLIKVALQDFTAEYGNDYVGAVKGEDGLWRTFMQSDGIHYTVEGGEYLMKKFIMQLHRDYEFEAKDP